MYGIASGNGVLSYVSQWATLIVDGGDSRGLNVTTLMTMMIEIFNFFFIKKLFFCSIMMKISLHPRLPCSSSSTSELSPSQIINRKRSPSPSPPSHRSVINLEPFCLCSVSLLWRVTICPSPLPYASSKDIDADFSLSEWADVAFPFC